MNASKRCSIAIVADDRITREKNRLLQRVINEVRKLGMVQVFASSTDEKQLLSKLESQPFKLILVPWHRYVAWHRIDPYLGLTRTNGSAFVGYAADSLHPFELGERSDRARWLMIDFHALLTSEATLILRTMINETLRSGIRPLLSPNTTIYCDTWFANEGLGYRLDTVTALPEILTPTWSKRINSLRICLSAFWSLVNDEGAGNSQLAQATAAASKTPKASLQVGADERCLSLRLCYNRPGVTAKDLSNAFWVDPNQPNSPYQLLLKHADFVRAHVIADSSAIEITATLLASSPSEAKPDQVRSVWIDPISPQLVTEAPYEIPSQSTPHLKPLTITPQKANTVRDAEEKAKEKAKERFIFLAAVKMRDLKKTLAEREETIRELKSGGLGVTTPLPIPDAEALLDAFEARYQEAKNELEVLKDELLNAEQKNPSAPEAEQLRNQIKTLNLRERAWLKKISSILELNRNTDKKQAA